MDCGETYGVHLCGSEGEGGVHSASGNFGFQQVPPPFWRKTNATYPNPSMSNSNKKQEKKKTTRTTLEKKKSLFINRIIKLPPKLRKSLYKKAFL